KKLSNFSHRSNWKMASNYVSKRYLETVDRNVYFEDVRLQMEAKLWGEEYNRHRPPKQVLRLTRWRWGWGRPSQGLSSTRVSPGGHRADVRGGDDGPAGETSLPPGALHRGQVHQVQLKLWLRAGRQHPPDPPGEPPRPGPRMCLTLTSSVCPPGLQPLLLRAVGPPADRGGHPGGGGPVHRPADPHGEGHRLRRWEPGVLRRP
ncbi:unnamed protein product, partial [Tetraodon nigroviridis]